MMLWTATLSAPFLSSAPILRDIADPPPSPRPVEMAITIMKNGRTNPTAARASGPTVL